MIIRTADISDRNHVLMLLNQLGEVINARVQFDPDNIRAHEAGKQNYDEAMARDDRKVFVAEDNGVIVGVATYFILTDFITGKQYAHIDDFVVEKNLRGTGVGTTLLEYIKAYAKEHHMTTLELTSSLALTDAHRFYERRGGVFARKVIKFML